jgi:hypothetical protein
MRKKTRSAAAERMRRHRERRRDGLRCPRECRWGPKGSLALAVAGPKAELRRDHETGDGGDLRDLIEHFRGGTSRPACDFAAKIVGGIVIELPQYRPPPT